MSLKSLNLTLCLEHLFLKRKGEAHGISKRASFTCYY